MTELPDLCFGIRIERGSGVVRITDSSVGERPVIIVFGSILVDVEMRVERPPLVGETLLCRDYLMTQGGKGANQACAAAKAGATVKLFGKVGNDGFADWALDRVRDAGVDVSGVGEATQHTGIANILVDSSGENFITVGAGANLEAKADLVPDSDLGPESLVCMQMEVTDAENWTLVERAKKNGARIMLNVAPAGMVPEAALRVVDILIVNEVEGAHIAREVGLEIDQPTRVPRLLHSRYGLTCILTLGGAGLLAFGPDGGWSVPGLPLSPVDTTAAGDAFAGALAAAIDTGMSIPDAIRFGSVGAGISVTREGAQRAMATREEIEASLEKLPPSRRLA